MKCSLYYMIPLTVGLVVGQILGATATTICEEERAVRFNPERSSQTMGQDRGYVQLYINNTWTNICNGLNRLKANVVCRQLGYIGSNGRGDEETLSGSSINTSINLTNPQACYGYENALTECPYLNITKTSSCQRRWIQCLPDNCTDGSPRLVGGASYSKGRVEVCVGGRWDTVCYNEQLTETVCQQLGFGSQGLAIRTLTPLPKVNCTVMDGLLCGNISELGTCEDLGLTVQCIKYSQDSTTTTAMGATIGLLGLVEVVTLAACIIACFRARNKHSKPVQQQQDIKMQSQINESYRQADYKDELNVDYNTVTKEKPTEECNTVTANTDTGYTDIHVQQTDEQDKDDHETMVPTEYNSDGYFIISHGRSVRVSIDHPPQVGGVKND